MGEPISEAAKLAMNCGEDIAELLRSNPQDGGSRVFQGAITIRIEEAITTTRAADAQRIAELERERDEREQVACILGAKVQDLRTALAEAQRQAQEARDDLRWAVATLREGMEEAEPYPEFVSHLLNETTHVALKYRCYLNEVPARHAGTMKPLGEQACEPSGSGPINPTA